MPLRVQFEITGPQGSPWLSTMHFSGTTLANAQGAANAVRAFWLALQGKIHGTAVGRVLPDVIIINDITGLPTGSFTVTPGDPISFTGGQPLLPPTTQALVRWRTGVYDAGREIRGRTFIPGITTFNNDQGKPDSALLANLTSAAAALVADANSELVVYSKKAGASAVVTGGSPWTLFAELRTRRD